MGPWGLQTQAKVATMENGDFLRNWKVFNYSEATDVKLSLLVPMELLPFWSKYSIESKRNNRHFSDEPKSFEKFCS
jgi:hypothetical protein